MKRFVRSIGALAFSSVLSACGSSALVPAPALPNAVSQAEVALRVTSGDVASTQTARILSYHPMLLRTQQRRAGAEEGRLKYPADLVRKNGPIMKTASSFNVYVNCKSGGESCWGDPEGFQKHLTGSRFAALLRQYTNSDPSAYTFGGSFAVRYRTYTKLFYQNDLLAVVHAALVNRL